MIDKIVANENYVELELNNGTTKITGILKDNVNLFTKTYSVGERIVCRGRVRKRRKNNCLDIIYISKNMLEQENITKFSSDYYIKRFHEVISMVEDVDYKKILDNCFNDDVKELFFTHPGAKDNHHNYIHGLLQHTIEVVDVCLMIADYFKDVNRDLLITGAILHDIGKLKAYDVDEDFKKIEKSDWHHLLGHLSISALFVSKITPVDIDSKKMMMLYHMILSHHGELSYGSPVVCQLKEAYLLNKADEISFTFNHLSSLSYSGSWAKDDLFKRSWFRS